jgi:hypothetical protein
MEILEFPGVDPAVTRKAIACVAQAAQEQVYKGQQVCGVRLRLEDGTFYGSTLVVAKEEETG